MYNNRQQSILDLVNEKGSILLCELEETFPDVSSMTLRRDLILLENENHIIRTKGGAVSISKISSVNEDEPLYTFRELENIEAKKEIARRAFMYVENGRSIYLDSGSTLMCLARIMKDEPYTIITSGLNIAIEILKKKNPSVVTLGGQVNRNTISVSGPSAMSYLDKINIDIAFMSASGYSSDNGFTVSNIYESELKKYVIAKAKKIIVLMDSSKIDRVLAFTFAVKKDVDLIITEKDIVF
jgi:DeoR/GlpR family transcriptional regulator of sugar metabolism